MHNDNRGCCEVSPIGCILTVLTASCLHSFISFSSVLLDLNNFVCHNSCLLHVYFMYDSLLLISPPPLPHPHLFFLLPFSFSPHLCFLMFFFFSSSFFFPVLFSFSFQLPALLNNSLLLLLNSSFALFPVSSHLYLFTFTFSLHLLISSLPSL